MAANSSGSFAQGLGDVGIASTTADTANNWSPAAAEPASEQFLGADYQSTSENPEPGAPPPDWFGSNKGS